MNPAALAALVALLAAGPLPAQGIAAARFDGRPAFAEGIDLGYYLWRDNEDTWHVRWTTMGQQRRFTGAVTAEGGDIKDLKRIDVETERNVIFAALTNDDIDGFNFKVDKDAMILRFVLNVDGQERSGIVEIGANNTKIKNLPLFVNLR